MAPVGGPTLNDVQRIVACVCAALVASVSHDSPQQRLVVGKREVVDLAPGDKGALFTLEIAEPGPLSLSAWSHHADIDLRVEDPSGAVLARDQDGGIATNPWLHWTPPAPGAYRVRLLGRSDREVKVGVRVLLGALAPDPPDPVRAERAYWEAALLRGHQNGDEGRVSEAAGRLVELGVADSVAEVRAWFERWNERVDSASTWFACADESVKSARYQEGRVFLEEASTVVADLAGQTSYVASLAAYDLARVSCEAGSALELKALRLVVDTLEQIRPEHDEDLLEARVNLAVKLTDAGQLAAARALDERVLDVCRRVLPPDSDRTLTVTSNLAFKLKGIGDWLGCLVLEEQVLAARERTSRADDPELVRARANLAWTLQKLGRDEEANALFESVLDSWERQRRPQDEQRMLLLRSDLARRRGLFEEALGHARDAVEAARARLPELHPDVLYAKAEVAMLLGTLGRFPEAELLREEILAGREIVFPEGDPYLQNTIANLAWDAHRRGDAVACERYLRRLCAGGTRALDQGRSLSWREGIAAANDQHWELTTALSLVARAADKAELEELLFRWIETRRALAVRYRFLARSDDDDETESARSAVLAARSRCAELIETARAGTALDEDALRSAIRERDAAEHRWALRTRDLVPPPLTVENIARALPPRCAAVGWIRHMIADAGADVTDRVAGQEHFLAYVIAGDGSLVRIDLGPVGPIVAAVDKWRSALGVPLRWAAGPHARADQRRTAGERLRELVLDPALAASGTVEALVACPDDVLHAVALDCLPLDGGCVGDRMTIYRMLSFDPLLTPRVAAERPPPRLLAVGGIDYDGLPPLPHAAREVVDAAVLFAHTFAGPADLLTGDDATASAFVRAAPGATHLLVATHAWFEPPGRNDDPADLGQLSPLTYAGLKFAGRRSADAILLGEELAAVDLSHCELAVLSACSSHLGVHWAGRGVGSLHAALTAGGARSTVTTLWPVNDARAQEMVQLFYEGMWSEHLLPSEALWRARSVLRARYVPEREWAAFVLMGPP